MKLHYPVIKGVGQPILLVYWLILLIRGNGNHRSAIIDISGNCILNIEFYKICIIMRSVHFKQSYWWLIAMKIFDIILEKLHVEYGDDSVQPLDWRRMGWTF